MDGDGRQRLIIDSNLCCAQTASLETIIVLSFVIYSASPCFITPFNVIKSYNGFNLLSLVMPSYNNCKFKQLSAKENWRGKEKVNH